VKFGFLFSGLVIKTRETGISYSEKELKHRTRLEKTKACCMKIPYFFQKCIEAIFTDGLEVPISESNSLCKTYFFWEIVIWFSKLALILVSIFGADINQDIQMDLTLIIFAFFLYIQLRNKPYRAYKKGDVLDTLHVFMLITILIVSYTRNNVRDFNVSYNQWKQEKLVRGQVPITLEQGMIARLYEFNSDFFAFFQNLCVYLVISLTFLMDLWMIYHIYR
jgi:hypothetical protein